MKPTLQFVFNLFCLLLFATAVQAQSEEQVRDVQKIYKDAKAPGLEVTIYLQEKNGAMIPVSPDREFHKGESVKIRVESNFSGYLYIVNHGASGNKSLIFPDGKESNLLQTGKTYLLPSTYDLVLDEKAGFETLQVIAAPQRLPVLDAALKQPDGKLNSKQIAAIAEYWNDSAPGKPGISAGTSSNQNQSVSSTFDKGKNKTTILSEDDSRDPTFWPNKPKPKAKKNLNTTISLGIKLKNTGQ
ncbi:MAG: DUF4384 domain-containing protein [Acidobacteriota bacterium]|nr:DUF4384 domain-containing protein [Acidobacteriota bacterium]